MSGGESNGKVNESHSSSNKENRTTLEKSSSPKGAIDVRDVIWHHSRTSVADGERFNKEESGNCDNMDEKPSHEKDICTNPLLSVDTRSRVQWLIKEERLEDAIALVEDRFKSLLSVPNEMKLDDGGEKGEGRGDGGMRRISLPVG